MTIDREWETFVDHPDAASFALERLRDLGIYAIDHEPHGVDLTVVNVLLTGDARISALHRDFMGIAGSTDIMTFPAELEPGKTGRGGDIVISVDAARENGQDAGHSTWDEVRFLVVHGVLHLCGWDDQDDDHRAAMLTRQSEIIAAFDARI